jgi:hypothetical protein
MDTKYSYSDKSYTTAKLLKGNSCKLKMYKAVNYPEVIAVTDALFEEMKKKYILRFDRKSSIVKFKYHIQFFVLNLYKNYCNDPERVIAYSRDRNQYSNKKSVYNKKFKLSYRYSVEAGKGVINFLVELGYIETFSFQHNRQKGGPSYQSRMRATEKLFNLIQRFNVSDDMIEIDYSQDEIIIMKGQKSNDKIIKIVNSNGNTVRKKISGKRKVCKTPSTAEVKILRKNLQIINDVMDSSDITLGISDDELRELNVRLRDDPDPNKQAIDFSRKRLHRVFLERRLDRGGRFYGAWYQNIPKEYRKRILINGKPVLELDYSSLHPNLLYFLAGEDPPEGDLYQLDGYSKDTRKFLKGVFLRLINSRTRAEAKGSIREAAFFKEKLRVPKELGKLEDKFLDPLIDAFFEKHKPLTKFIFTIDNLGIILQNIDSQIAEKVLLYFALKGIPVLPMHDSFIIYAELYQELEEIMKDVCMINFNKPIGVSNDNYGSLVEILVDRWAERFENGEIDEKEFKKQFKDLKSNITKLNMSIEKYKTWQGQQD